MNLNPFNFPVAAKVVVVVVIAGGAGFAAFAMHGSSTTGSSRSANPVSSPAAATGAAEPGITSYLCSFNNGPMLLQWTDSGGYLSGTYQLAQISGQAPNESVNTSQGNLSGTIKGSGITLNVNSSQAWYGTVNGSSVTVNVPQTDGTIQAQACNSTDISGWNQVVDNLNSQATSDNNSALQQQQQASQAAALQNAQQSLSQDVSTLLSDASSLDSNTQLASDINQMKKDLGQEQADLNTEETQGSCSDGSMGTDAAQVSTDSSQVDTDLSSLQTDMQSLQGSGGISGIQSDIASVNSDVSTIKNYGASPAVNPSQALAAGNKAISDTNSAIQWATGQGNMIDAQAHQLATTAQNYESSKGC